MNKRATGVSEAVRIKWTQQVKEKRNDSGALLFESIQQNTLKIQNAFSQIKMPTSTLGISLQRILIIDHCISKQPTRFNFTDTGQEQWILADPITTCCYKLSSFQD